MAHVFSFLIGDHLNRLSAFRLLYYLIRDAPPVAAAITSKSHNSGASCVSSLPVGHWGDQLSRRVSHLRSRAMVSHRDPGDGHYDSITVTLSSVAVCAIVGSVYNPTTLRCVPNSKAHRSRRRNEAAAKAKGVKSVYNPSRCCKSAVRKSRHGLNHFRHSMQRSENLREPAWSCWRLTALAPIGLGSAQYRDFAPKGVRKANGARMLNRRKFMLAISRFSNSKAKIIVASPRAKRLRVGLRSQWQRARL